MNIRRMTIGCAMLVSCAVACAQDEPPVTVDESIANVMEIEPPGDLPGHDRGAREKSEAPKEEEAPAQSEEPRDWFGHKPYWEWSRATGDWGGARSKLEGMGIDFEGSYTLDWSSVRSGGDRRLASHARL